MEIQYYGLEHLDTLENAKIQKIAQRAYPKMERMVKNPFLRITIKKYNTTGKRSKISLHARIAAPSIICLSTAHDWDIARAAHKVFDKLEKEIEHKTKTISFSKARLLKGEESG